MQVEAWGDGQYVPSHPANNHWHDAAHRETSDNYAGGNRQDLQHIDSEYRSTVRASNFQSPNAGALAGEIAAHAIADANARDD
jgi:hypothetical protein